MDKSELESYEILDLGMLSESSMGDADFEQQLIEVFMSTAPNLISDYETAVREDRWTDAHRAVHSLKGSCRALGMMRLGMVCETVEAWSRTNRTEEEPFSPEDLRTELGITVGVLRTSRRGTANR